MDIFEAAEADPPPPSAATSPPSANPAPPERILFELCKSFVIITQRDAPSASYIRPNYERSEANGVATLALGRAYVAALGCSALQARVHVPSSAEVRVLANPVDATRATVRNDDHFIELALKAQAHYLVSGDKDLPEAPLLAGLRIVSVHQALDDLSH